MKKPVLIAAAVAFVLGLLAWPTGRAVSDQIVRVIVTNLPNPQNISGSVSVKGVIRHGLLVERADVIVSPAGRHETTQLTPAGIVETDGFSAVVLSLAGEVKGEILRPGEVGLLLLPDVEPLVRSFQEDGALQLPLEVTAEATPGTPYFSASKPFLLAFPRYRAYLYNTADRSVSANVYAYLTY